MSKAPLVVAIGLWVSLGGLCADFWQVKAPGEWSEKELARIQNNSPWAFHVQQSKRGTETKTETVRSGKSTKTKTVKNRVTVALAPVLIRWESAPASLAATERVDPKLFHAYQQLVADYYLVSVKGMVISGSDP